MPAQYKLVKIIDAYSNLKSPFAQEICAQVLRGEYNIDYVTYDEASNDEKSLNCQNNAVRKVKVNGAYMIKDIARKACGTKIKDNFIVAKDDGTRLTIGNSCIQLFLQAGLLRNVDAAEFDKIIKVLKTIHPCMLCGKNTSKHIHRKCICGEMRASLVDRKAVLTLNTLRCHIKIYPILKHLQALIPENTIVRRTSSIMLGNERGKVDTSTYSALCKLKRELNSIFKEKKKLLALKNNVIVNSIKRQRRPPTIKQRAILERILKDYDRIKKLDDANTSPEYKSYGYVYPSF